jgi:hypothetical protein
MRVEQDVRPVHLTGCYLPPLGHGKQLRSFVIR